MKSRTEIAAAEALKAAAGNMPVAEAKLIQELLRDQQLLIEAVAPYLKPIATRLIDRARRPLAAPKRATGSGIALNAIAEQPGYNPMLAEKAGDRPPASVRHVKTMEFLASSYRRKPEKEKV